MVSFMSTTGFLKSQDMIKILTQLGQDFSGKRLCDGYFMDTIWRLCERVVCFCEKASLRICYIILFECKGPWMPKTDNLIF